MKKNGFRKDDRGETLVMVIIAALFVAVLATIVLTVTTYSIKNVALRNKGTDSFYSAEEAVNEMEAVLRENANTAFGKAYTRWLQQYINVDTEESKALFYKYFAEEYTNQVEKTIIAAFREQQDGSHKGVQGLLPAYTSYFEQDIQTGKVTAPAGNYVIFTDVPSVRKDGAGNTYIDDGKVALDNVKIIYVDNNGTAKKIETDITLTVAYPGLLAEGDKGSVNEYCADYIFINDGTLKNDSGLKNVVIAGNVYAGEAIEFNGFGGEGNVSVKFDSSGVSFKKEIQSLLLTRNSFNVKNKAKVTVVTGTDDRSGLWAKDIVISDSNSDRTYTELSVTGACYLVDDLALNASYSKFSIKGKYVGYSTVKKNSEGFPEASGSSSIVINGKNSYLNLSEADVIIAGKTFISVPTESEAFQSIQQGESLTFKALQSAYLVPGDCVVGLYHNPITAEEYRSGVSVDISLARKKLGIRLENYVNSNQPYRTMVVKYGTTNMVYFYLNFKNPDKAAQFFRDYCNLYPEMTDDRMEHFGENGTILVNANTIQSTGNILIYENGKAELLSPNKKYNDDTLDDYQIQYSSMYSGYCSLLDPDYSGTQGARLTDQIVNFSKVPNPTEDVIVSRNSTDGVRVVSLNDSECYKIITGKNISISEQIIGTVAEGKTVIGVIIVATGDVHINASVSLTGLVVAAGDIVMNGVGNRFTADPDNVDELIRNNSYVNSMFAVGSGGVSASGNDFISTGYENWKK